MRSPSPFWKTWAALAVLAGLGAYIYFVEMKRDPNQEKPKEKVFSIEKAKVQELALQPGGGEEVRLAKEGEAWRLTAPVQAAADASEVQALLSSLETLEVEEVASESPSDLAPFGLAQPKNTVSVRVQGASEPLRLLIGEKTPDGGALYAKRPAQARVFTIPSYLESTFAKKAFDMRDRDVLHVKRDAVKTLEVTGGTSSYALTRDARGEWAFTRPLQTRAGRWAVDGLLGSLEGLRFESIAAEQAQAKAKFGLDPPSYTVTLGLAEGGSKRLEVGKSAGENKHYAWETSSDMVTVIPGALVQDLGKGMGELRAQRLLDVATYEVTSIEVVQQGGRKLLSRSAVKDKEGIDVYKWKRTAPDGKDLDTNTVQDALFLVGGAEAQEFVDAPLSLEAYGLDQPVMRVTLSYEDTAKGAIWFELGRKDGVVYARRLDDSAVLKLDPAKGEELIKAFAGL